MPKFYARVDDPDSGASLTLILKGPGELVSGDTMRWMPDDYEVRAAAFDLDADDFGPIHVTVAMIAAKGMAVYLTTNADDAATLVLVLEPGDAYVEVVDYRTLS